MSLRLPLVSARPSPVRTEPVARGSRVQVARPLLCVTAAGHGVADNAAALHGACALIEQLAARGRAVAGLVVRDDAGGDGGVAALRAAGATPTVVLERADLTDAALAAIDALSPATVVVGVGAELAQRLSALLTLQIGKRTGAASAGADLELHTGAEAVASEIGAWLALR